MVIEGLTPASRTQGTVMAFSLLALLILTYRSKMVCDRPPTGSCLFAWRLTHGGAAIFFLTIAAVCLFDQLLSPSAWLFLIGSGVVAAFIGVVAWNIGSCACKK